MILLALALVPLVALRASAAFAEGALAAGSRATAARDATLAAAARATAAVASGAAVGIVTTLVWSSPGRGMIPLVLAVVAPAGLVLFDLVPRGLAPGAPVRPVVEPVLAVAGLVLTPLLLLRQGLARVLRTAATPSTALRRLGGWLAAQAGRGPLEVTEAGLVARIVRFAGRTAHDAMVAHVDVCAVPDTATVGEVVALGCERGFSRLPVFHERQFNMIGLVSTFDLLGVTELDRPVTAVMREPLFVPESKPLPELLATLQVEGRNLAIVVDEYGGAVGLVTIEDLVEEIVGEIEDEYDPPKELYRRVAPGVFVVSARAPVADVNERFGWNLPQGEYETVGGLVLERLGRVPKPGDGMRAGRVHLEVTRASPRAVQELRVRVG